MSIDERARTVRLDPEPGDSLRKHIERVVERANAEDGIVVASMFNGTLLLARKGCDVGTMLEQWGGTTVLSDPINLNQRSLLERIIAGQLQSCIDAHGPITREHVHSASKRVIAAIKAWNKLRKADAT